MIRVFTGLTVAFAACFAVGQNSNSALPKIQTTFSEQSTDRIPEIGRSCFELSKATHQALLALKQGLPVQFEAASVMAQAYFEHVYGACGAMNKPVESTSNWSFPCVVGVGATPAESIVVEKATGRITCGSYESFDSLPAFRGHLTLGSTRTPPALPPVLSQHPASSAPLSASAQAWPVSLVR